MPRSAVTTGSAARHAAGVRYADRIGADPQRTAGEISAEHLDSIANVLRAPDGFAVGNDPESENVQLGPRGLDRAPVRQFRQFTLKKYKNHQHSHSQVTKKNLPFRLPIRESRGGARPVLSSLNQVGRRTGKLGFRCFRAGSPPGCRAAIQSLKGMNDDAVESPENLRRNSYPFG